MVDGHTPIQHRSLHAVTESPQKSWKSVRGCQDSQKPLSAVKSPEAEEQVLLRIYPQLAAGVPWMPIGSFPTPVVRLENLGQSIGVRHLYVKCDDACATPYGGNKIRKLEFLLGDAVRNKAQTLFTGNVIGSHFSLATAIYGQRLGMRVVLFLQGQPTSKSVKDILLLEYFHGAKLVHVTARTRARAERCQRWANVLRRPYHLPVGGTCPLGDLGFISAAFELKAQIQQGLLPEPDYLFVAVGSMGTFCGLWLGCRAAGLNTMVIGVNVSRATPKRGVVIIDEMVRYVRAIAPAFPKVVPREEELHILQGFDGEGYGQYTSKSRDAIALMEATEKIRLDGTYSGKTLAAAMEYLQCNGRKKGKAVLFWNTYNSNDVFHPIVNVDYHVLPKEFHQYFEMPEQEFELPR